MILEYNSKIIFIILFISTSLLSCKKDLLLQNQNELDYCITIENTERKESVSFFLSEDYDAIQVFYLDKLTNEKSKILVQTNQNQLDIYNAIIIKHLNAEIFTKKTNNMSGVYNVSFCAYTDNADLLKFEYLNISDFKNDISPEFSTLLLCFKKYPQINKILKNCL